MSHDSRLESHKCIEPAHQSDTLGNLAHRERHTWQVGFAPERIVADAQHLAERAEQHLLVGVEARQTHTVNTHPAVDGAARAFERPTLDSRVWQIRTARRADVARGLYRGA